MNNYTYTGPANLTSAAPLNATATVPVGFSPTPAIPAAASTVHLLPAAWTVVAPGFATVSAVFTSARKTYTACKPAFQVSKHIYSGAQWVKSRMHKRTIAPKRVSRSATGKAAVVKPEISRRRGRKSVLNYQSRTIVGLSCAAQQRNYGGSVFSLGDLQEKMSDQQEYFGRMGPRSTEFTKASLRAMNREGLVRYNSQLDEIQIPDPTRKKMREMPCEDPMQGLSPKKKTKADLENEVNELRNQLDIPPGPSRLWQTASISTISTDASDYQRDVDMEDIPEVDEEVENARIQDGERAASAAPTERVPTPPPSLSAAPATPRPLLGSPTPELSYASFNYQQPDVRVHQGVAFKAGLLRKLRIRRQPRRNMSDVLRLLCTQARRLRLRRLASWNAGTRSERNMASYVRKHVQGAHTHPAQHSQDPSHDTNDSLASQMRLGPGSISGPSDIVANLHRLQAHTHAEIEKITRQAVDLRTQHHRVRAENGQLRIDKDKIQVDYDMARQELRTERITADDLRARVDELNGLVQSGVITQEALEQQLQGLQRDYQASQAEA
ncbi:hypothetical protein EWM64_g10288, partial [Hericium alpestre]